MRESKPIVIQVSFKTKVQEDLLLYSWALQKFNYYGRSEYIKMILREKMYEEENNK